jgi:hypothetical protein
MRLSMPLCVALAAATVLSATGWQAKGDSIRANGGSIIFVDGKSVFLGALNPDAPKNQ